MKATDLMVGDWVYVSGKPVKITNDDLATMLIFLDDDSKISPIPIIEDILVKNGFEKTTDDWNRHIPLIIFESVGFPTISIHADMDMKHFWVHGTIDLTYVHQLQRLLNLCNIDKEIIL